MYFQLLKLKRYHLNEELLKGWQNYAWRAFTTIVRPTLLVAGHLFRHDIESYYYHNKLSHFDAYRIYDNAITFLLKTYCAYAVLVKDVPAELVTYFSHYAPQYLMLRNDILMEMSIPSEWQSIKEYEKALKHKYAQRFRKIRNAWANVEVKELSADDVQHNKHTIYELYRQVCEKQPARIGLLGPEFLPLLKKEYPNDLKIWGIYEAGKLVGFFSAWVKNDVFDMFYIGFDYTRNAELQLYFNILFFGVEQAILHKKSKVIFGRTALDAKARLGCKPRYQSTFVFVRNRMIRMATLRLQNNNQSQEGEWEQRHPFKEISNSNS
jgi:hypothetical protein